jgi:hypothetical protein
MNKQPKVHVVLKKPHAVVGVIDLAQAVDTAITSNATTFPSPNPAMPKFSSDIAALIAAQAAAKARTQGAVDIRNAKLAIVVADLEQLRVYVETVANSDPSNAVAIVHSAGMEVRKAHTAPPKDAVNIKQAKAATPVVLTARVGTRKKQVHEWEYSTDGGKTWVALPPTTMAKTTVPGLTPGASVLARHRASTSTATDAWSVATASLLVR